MGEAAPMTSQGVPEGGELIVDPAKAEEMAYAGKFHREQAVGLANAIQQTITNGEQTVSDPYFLDATGKEKMKYSVPDAVRAADEHNQEADVKEDEAGTQYDTIKAQNDAAMAQLAAIKAGKRIVQGEEQPK